MHSTLYCVQGVPGMYASNALGQPDGLTYEPLWVSWAGHGAGGVLDMVLDMVCSQGRAPCVVQLLLLPDGVPPRLWAQWAQRAHRLVPLVLTEGLRCQHLRNDTHTKKQGLLYAWPVVLLKMRYYPK